MLPGVRTLPDFLIIGAQKCGTTSLFDLLAKHPDVRPPRVKEVHFFENAGNYAKGPEWYASFFPVLREGEGFRTGEATPFMYHRAVPARVRALLPDARLLAILRDPVERAFSHYLHNKAAGKEELPFAQALEMERERIAAGDEELRGEGPRAVAYRRFGYFDRGLYAGQLDAWAGYFGRDRIAVFFLEDFLRDPRSNWERVCSHLGLRPVALEALPHRNRRSIDEAMGPRVAAALYERYEASDERLERIIGRTPPWRRPGP